MSVLNILIAEDHTLVAKLISQMISTKENLHVIGIVNNGNDVIKLLSLKKPDIILMDIDMPVLDGIETTEKVHKKNPEIKIIILSNHIEPGTIKKALQAGASGYISKFADSSEVFEAIRTVMNGGTFYCKTTMKAVMDNIAHVEETDKYITATKKLSEREKEILSMIAQEYTTKMISHKLIISPRTVETHRRNIMKKLGVKNSAGLVKLYMENYNFIANNSKTS